MKKIGMVQVGVVCVLTVGFLLVTLSMAQAANVEEGKAHYTELCAKCHGDTGKGDGPTAKKFELKMGDYTDKAAMAKLTDEYIVKITKVGGKALEKNPKMRAYEQKLTDDQIKDVTAYIRTFSK
jgi:mono/diheme cytochrome c family protein